MKASQAVRFFYLSLNVATVLACAACRPQDEIATYTVERTSPPREPFVAAEVADQLDRTLAAMLPVGDQVYFFKIAGKAPAVARHRDAFVEFLSNVDKSDSPDKPLGWKLPDGWTEKGASEMRLETIAVPDESGELEIAVSSLPMSGSWEEFVTMNVNRWLGQLSQGDLPRQTILNLTEKVSTAAGPATLIELAGVMKDTMAKDPHGDAGVAKPPTAPTQQTPSSTATEFTFDTPEGWQPGRVSSMRKAAFMIVEGDQQAEFTVIDLPSAGGAQITDVMANVQRWAAQVGIPADANLEDLIEKIKIDDVEGSFANLEGPESANPRQAMLAAMVVRGEKVWFFKLVGAAALVERESKNFSEFLGSVHFK